MIAFAEAWMDWVARGLVLSAALLVIAWALHAALGRRLSARAAHALALLPLVPLLMPRWTTWQAPSIEGRALQSIAERTGFVQVDRSAPTQLPATPQHVSEAAAFETTAIAPELLAARDSGWPIEVLLMAAWALGACAFTFVLVHNLRGTQRVLQRATPLADADARRIHRLVPATRSVRLLQTDQLASPAAWGWSDRRIVLPQGLVDELDDAQLAWVLRHELAHHTRRDLPLSLLQRLVQIVWWFHPALWWWSQRIELTRECACDEQAARALSGDRRPAATALLAVAERPRLAPHAALALHSSTDPVRTMKTRLTRLLQPRPSRLAGFATSSLCALLAAGSLLLSQSVWTFDSQEPVEVEDPGFVQDQVWDENEAVLLAQRFLLEQQRADGSWPTGRDTNEPTGEFTSLGTTAFALLALEQRHPLIDESAWKSAMQKGVSFLRGSFDGKVFAHGEQRFRVLADHAAATIATHRLRDFASGWDYGVLMHESVATLLRAQNPYGGWRFSLQPDGDNDSFMTSFVLLALADANWHGHDKGRIASLRSAQMYLESMTDPDSGRVGYQQRGAHDARFKDRVVDYPVKYTELCTAITMVAAAENGSDLLAEPINLRSLTLVATKPPVWNKTNGSVDYNYWYFGARAVNLIGGKLAERWNTALREALARHQRADGSWPAVDAWSTDGTDVHATAMALLAWQATRADSAGGR